MLPHPELRDAREGHQDFVHVRRAPYHTNHITHLHHHPSGYLEFLHLVHSRAQQQVSKHLSEFRNTTPKVWQPLLPPPQKKFSLAVLGCEPDIA